MLHFVFYVAARRKVVACLLICALLFAFSPIAAPKAGAAPAVVYEGVQVGSDGRLIPSFYDKITTFETGKTPQRVIYVTLHDGGYGGSGTSDDPYKNFNAAVTAAKSYAASGYSTAIYIKSGTYDLADRNVMLYASELRGTEENPIWIGGDPAGATRPILDGGGKANSEGIKLSECAYLILHNIEVRNFIQNGINIDDGGKREAYDAAHHFVFRNLYVHSIGDGGNQDHMKFSGINNYFVFDNEATNEAFSDKGSHEASGIDQVGCHEAYIAGNYYHDLGGNAFQFKGGGYDSDITQNLMVNAGERAVIIGGSGDNTAARFHPDVAAAMAGGEPGYEATDIRVYANLFIGADAPVAFVTAKNCYFVNNTVINPKKYLMRIIHEDGDGSIYNGVTKNNVVANNIFYYGSLSMSINAIPSNPMLDLSADSFVVKNNLYYRRNSAYYADGYFSYLTHQNAIGGQNPLFTSYTGDITGDYTLQGTSPAASAGTPFSRDPADEENVWPAWVPLSWDWLVADYTGRPYNRTMPNIGAFDQSRKPGIDHYTLSGSISVTGSIDPQKCSITLTDNNNAAAVYTAVIDPVAKTYSVKLPVGSYTLTSLMWRATKYTHKSIVIEDKDVTSAPIVHYLGDINADGSINSSDIAALLSQFLFTSSIAQFDPVHDLDLNGVINTSDIVILLSGFNLADIVITG